MDKKKAGLEYGLQPLDEILKRLKLTNHDLVSHSTEQLSHKMIAKGRKGRKLNPHVKQKIVNALNAAKQDRIWTVEDLFNY